MELLGIKRNVVTLSEKGDMEYSVTQHGKPLSKDLYTFDVNNMLFFSDESDLVLDFPFNGCTFKTRNRCTFKTNGHCVFDTGASCTFKTGNDCTFKTGTFCTFNTGSNCTFNTSNYCTFTTANDCTFNTGTYCAIVGFTSTMSRKVIDVGKYVPALFLGMEFQLEDYERLKDFPLNEPEQMILHTKDELGMRLFKYLKENN